MLSSRPNGEGAILESGGQSGVKKKIPRHIPLLPSNKVTVTPFFASHATPVAKMRVAGITCLGICYLRESNSVHPSG